MLNTLNKKTFIICNIILPLTTSPMNPYQPHLPFPLPLKSFLQLNHNNASVCLFIFCGWIALFSLSLHSVVWSLEPHSQSESQFTTFLLGEIFELKAELNNEKKEKRKEAVKKVIAAMTVGKDVRYGVFKYNYKISCKSKYCFCVQFVVSRRGKLHADW